MILSNSPLAKQEQTFVKQCLRYFSIVGTSLAFVYNHTTYRLRNRTYATMLLTYMKEVTGSNLGCDIDLASFMIFIFSGEMPGQ
jgi:hypothetical protein